MGKKRRKPAVICRRGNSPQGEFEIRFYLKVDVSALQPVGTALVEEVDVLYEETEEWNHNLEESSTTS